ncbi:MAG: FHA domain-containing protein [Betaproteobacteria bacterium]|jgi:predicted component of type VI protein secretion system|nr:FHA domain-containing protein [Betaproteobacteria bacterium]
MAKLILTLENTLVREVPLDKERITIGRKPSNDIQIENLAVSGEHACIVTILNDSFLEDMGSTNGTLVNGQSIKKHILQNNDVIEIGKYKLKYVAGAPAQAAAPAEDFEKTMILRPSARPAAAKPATLAPAAAAASAKPSMPPPTPTPRLVVPGAAPAAAPAAAVAAAAAKPGEGQLLAAVQILSGPSAGRELDLVKNLTTMGKPGVQVAVITRRPQGYFITHVEGVKFPIVNGKTIDAQAQPLRDHDVIELAGVKMEFFTKK